MNLAQRRKLFGYFDFINPKSQISKITLKREPGNVHGSNPSNPFLKMSGLDYSKTYLS